MRKNNCELVRHELDELRLDETFSSTAVEHLRECAACRELHEQQTKLRRMVGALGIVSAPPDFDFRLRARLANESDNVPATFMFGYWPWARRGLQVAGLALVIVIGVSLTRNALNQIETTDNVAKQAGSEVQPPAKPIETVTPVTPPSGPNAIAVADKPTPQRNNGRTANLSKPKRPLATMDFASQRAEVISGAEPVGVSAAFPIDASQQSFTVSFDDGRGNARTISVPAISFGSQRIVHNANQFAPKRAW